VLRSLRVIWLAVLIFCGYGSQLIFVRYLPAQDWVTRRWTRLHAQNAPRIAREFSALGGVFIKMGQVLSVMAPVLPPVFGTELSKLQDAVPPRLFAQLRPRLVEAWGEGFADQFLSIDETPLAAASLAQVHKATLKDGSAVVLKILYPEIETLVRNDLRTVRRLLPGFRILFGFRDSATVLAQLSAMLEHEMDYGREQSNIARLREILKGLPKIVIPRVFAELSTRCVLVLSFEAGLKTTLTCCGQPVSTPKRLLVRWSKLTSQCCSSTVCSMPTLIRVTCWHEPMVPLCCWTSAPSKRRVES
jgi:predicted unusual protein kinase regulating ubiquinone biosynthesis (AarF/ABC1/UbiB family)